MKKSFEWLGFVLSLAVVLTSAVSQAQQVAASPPATNPVKAVRPRKLSSHPVVALTFDDLPAAGSLPHGRNRTKVATELAAELKAAGLNGVYPAFQPLPTEKLQSICR